MTNKDSTSKQIYYRPANKWIEVTENDKRNWERFVGTIRKSRQRVGIITFFTQYFNRKIKS